VSVITTARERLAILQRTQTVAVVGMSANPARASHFVATYLNGATDWTIWYVNPGATEILGEKSYASLADLPEPPDIVDTFRRVDDLPAVAEAAIACGAGTLWFQLGLRHDAAAERAAEAGLDVVQDRCLKIEHARFAGGLHLAGFDTGVIDARVARLV
jgi:predicted CoA-binding protein